MLLLKIQPVTQVNSLQVKIDFNYDLVFDLTVHSIVPMCNCIEVNRDASNTEKL